MTNDFSIHVERDNVVRINFLINDILIDENLITRVVLKFGPYTVDTSNQNDSDFIWFLNNNRTIAIRLGLIEKIKPKVYIGYLTVYDDNNENGIAWSKVTVNVTKWPTNE